MSNTKIYLKNELRKKPISCISTTALLVKPSRVAFFIAFLLFTHAPILGQNLRIGLAASVNYSNRIVPGNMMSISPKITLGFEDINYLNFLQVSFGYDQSSVGIKGNFSISDEYGSSRGTASMTLGYHRLFSEIQFFLKAGKTRPYLKFAIGTLIPKFKSQGDLNLDQESYDWKIGKPATELLRTSMNFINLGGGLGLEHNFGNKIGVFVEWGLSKNIFTLKSKDLDVSRELLEDAMNDFDFGEDPVELESIEGHFRIKFLTQLTNSSIGLRIFI